MAKTSFEMALETELNSLKHGEIKEIFFWEEFSKTDMDNYQDDYKELQAIVKKLNIIDFKTVKCYGGEGQGDSYYKVTKFETPDEVAYIKFDGYYSSYEGSDYEKLFAVEPQEVTIIEYNPK